MSPRFRIENGQLLPEDAKGSLGHRTGVYTVMPTSPDLLVLSRSPAEGGSIPAPRVVLAGDASGFPLSDLIAFLSQSRWSGALRVHAPSGERSVLLRDGEVRGATSDAPADRFGEVLVRLGFVERARVEEVLREHPPNRLGRALVERGILKAHDLFKCLTHQVSEIFHAIVLCREGTFFLVDQTVEDRFGHNLRLSTQNLLMDSIRKIDELAHFRKRIPHGRLYVVRSRASDGKLEGEEERVLALLDGRRTLLDLAQVAKLSEFDITKIVFRLLEGGYAALSDKPVVPESAMTLEKTQPVPVARAAAPARPGPVDSARVARTFNAIFREICAEVSKQGQGRDFIAAANAALAGQALSSSPVLAGLALGADGTLPQARLEEAYERHKVELGADPLTAFRQALRDLMFFLLFQAGELLESSADEELGRRVKEMLATLGPA
jgi:hypothetical protein